MSATGEKLPGYDDPSLVVRGDPEGWGEVEGWGTFNLGGGERFGFEMVVFRGERGDFPEYCRECYLIRIRTSEKVKEVFSFR